MGNLSPATTEEDLADLFGRYGAIASVKVMWPRTEEERARKRNCGFVSFEQRRAADEARMELNDYVFKDYKMIVGWGKAVAKGSGGSAAGGPRSLAVALGMAMGAVKGFSDDPLPPLPAAAPTAAAPSEVKVVDDCVVVSLPADKKQKKVIDLLARFVSVDGEPFEQVPAPLLLLLLDSPTRLGV